MVRDSSLSHKCLKLSHTPISFHLISNCDVAASQYALLLYLEICREREREKEQTPFPLPSPRPPSDHDKCEHTHTSLSRMEWKKHYILVFPAPLSNAPLSVPSVLSAGMEEHDDEGDGDRRRPVAHRIEGGLLYLWVAVR